MQPLRSTRLAALAGLQRVEHVFDGVFGSRLNPWRNFGALGILFFFMLVASGVVLYAVLDTSATGAYRSIDELSRTPWTTGSVLRGLHR
jgi:quinol-cytochrome oxidoreductase complex cytochrome b subunit